MVKITSIFLITSIVVLFGLANTRLYESFASIDSLSQTELEVWEIVLERYKNLYGYGLSNYTMKIDSVTNTHEIDGILLKNLLERNNKEYIIPFSFKGFQKFRFFDYYGSKLMWNKPITLDSIKNTRNRTKALFMRMYYTEQQTSFFSSDHMHYQQIHLSRISFDSSTSTAIVCIKILGSASIGTNCEMGKQSNATGKDFKNFITTQNRYESTFLLQKRLGIWQILNQWKTELRIRE